MEPLALVMRILHIVPAVALAGGILFMWSSLLPGIASLDEEARKSVLAAVRGKWAKVVMGCSALLLASGLYNAIQNIIHNDYVLPYHALVTLKLVLAVAVMFITARLGGRSDSAEKFREKTPFWMSINTALVVVVIVLGSTMKASQKPPQAEQAEPSIELEVNVDEP